MLSKFQIINFKIVVNNTVLKVTNINKSYDELEVLKGISFGLHKKERVGLVGSNGSGKSTLLKIITGILTPDDGRLNFAASTRIGYFPQELPLNSLVTEFLTEEDSDEKYLRKIKEDMYKFGLNDVYLKKNINELSGGEKSKIALIRIMNSKADLFLLDEPTNNLDIPALVILENFILNSNKTFLVISHDRKFMDRIATKIIEIDDFSKKAVIYDGNYSNYTNIRNARIEKEWSQYGETFRKEKKIKKSVDKKMKGISSISSQIKNKGKISSKVTDKADSTYLRGKSGKIAKEAKDLKSKISEIQDERTKPETKLPLKLSFKIDERSGDNVFAVKGLIKRIGKVKIGPIDMSVKYGDKILILGPNGSGKSTLVKMLLNKTNPDNGEINEGSRVNIGYLPQEDYFASTNSIIEQFLKDANIESGLGRTLLYRFGINKNDLNKKISEISPGVRSRLILAIIMSKKVNCLILDEPSNHLDLEALEKLEEAVKRFEGTLVLVSHDRYFIDKLSFDKIYLLKKGEGLKSLTSYQEYEKEILD